MIPPGSRVLFLQVLLQSSIERVGAAVRVSGPFGDVFLRIMKKSTPEQYRLSGQIHSIQRRGGGEEIKRENKIMQHRNGHTIVCTY